MAESNNITWEFDSKFIPPYISNDLKWYERDGLETRYRRNQCEEFLENTDLHTYKRKIIIFDIIKNDISKNKLEQYQQIDHDEVKEYPPQYQEQIMSSIFQNSNRKDMNIEKRTIEEHFNNKKLSVSRGKFFKKCKDDMYAQFGSFIFYLEIKKCLRIVMAPVFFIFLV